MPTNAFKLAISLLVVVLAAGCGGKDGGDAPVSASKAATADKSQPKAVPAGGSIAKSTAGSGDEDESAEAGVPDPFNEDDNGEEEAGDDDKVAVEERKAAGSTLLEKPAVVGLAGIVKTAGVVGKVNALADRGCACSDAACFSATKTELDKLVASSSTTTFSADEVAKLKVAVDRLTGCEGKLAAPAAQAGTAPTAAGAEPDQASMAMAGAMRVVKGICRCAVGDAECMAKSMKEIEALEKEFGDDIVYTDEQKLAQKGLESEVTACMAKHEAAEAGTNAGANAAEPVAKTAPTPTSVATGDVPPQVGVHPRGKITRWDQLPNVTAVAQLKAMGQKRGSPYIDQVWGASMDQVMAWFPGSAKLEPTDLEPNTRYVTLELTSQDARKRKHKLVWKFLDDKLFQVSLELKRSEPNLHNTVQQALGRPSDAQSKEGWNMDVSTWTDGGLLIRAIKDGKSTDLSLAYRDRHVEYIRRGAKGRAAYLANRVGLKLLSGLKYSRKYRAVEKTFREALNIAPHYGHASVNLCRLYFYWGHFSHASRACQQARNSRTNSVHAEAAYYSGLLNIVQGYRANGLKWLRMVKGYDPDRRKPVYSADRHLRLLNGRGKKKDFKQAYKEVVCAWVSGDKKRATNFAKSYGYSTAQSLGKTAYRYGVNTDKIDKWATKRCR